MDGDAFNSEFNKKIEDFMEQTKLPGIAINFFTKDKILYSQGFGKRNLENDLPFTPDTINGYGSCVKAFTCHAIMILQSEGKLSINDPISKHLPVKYGDSIDVRHLMSHSSGIPSLGQANILSSQIMPFGDPSKIKYETWEN